jgi:hypothetical protein
LDRTTCSRESGSSSSTSDSDESNDCDSGSDVEITLSDADVEITNAGVEEGGIKTGGRVSAEADAGENLANVDAHPDELVKPNTCFMGRSLMTQAEMDALVSEGCFASDDCRLPGRETTAKSRSNKSVAFCDFFTAGLRLPVSKRFAKILVA